MGDAGRRTKTATPKKYKRAEEQTTCHDGEALGEVKSPPRTLDSAGARTVDYGSAEGCEDIHSPSMERPVERVVDLLDPALNRIGNASVEEARRRLFDPDPAGAVRG